MTKKAPPFHASEAHMRHDDFAVLYIFSIVRLIPSLEKSFLALEGDLFHVKHENMAILFHVEHAS